MKLEHLIQAYNFNDICATIKEEIKQDEEKAGVICFTKDVNASYLLDKEDIVISMIIYCNCLTENRTIKAQLSHTINVIKIIQKSIELLANVPQIEANIILKKLGLFDNSFKQGKNIKHLDHTFNISVVEGLLKFSLNEIITPGQFCN